jgi:hypothetical protein
MILTIPQAARAKGREVSQNIIFKDGPLAKKLLYTDGGYISNSTLAGSSVHVYVTLGCALTFASEAKFEIEAKISFRLEAKKNLISHDSLRCETPKI